MVDNNKRATYRINDELLMIVTMAHERPSDTLILSLLDTIPSQSVNLSAGGMAFNYPISLATGDSVFLAFLLTTTDMVVTCEAQVIRSELARDAQNKECYRTAVAFNNLSVDADQQIVQHIFKQEIERRKKAKEE